MALAALVSAPAASSRVWVDLKPGERMSFPGTGIEIEFVAKSGRQARLCVTSPRAAQIERLQAGQLSAKHAMIPATEGG